MMELIRGVRYGGWTECLRLTNGDVEVVAPTEVGPRLLRFGRVAGANQLYERGDELGTTGGDRWRAYGGHRLWVAPELRAATYAPENAPVTVEWNNPRLELTSPVDATTRLTKSIAVVLPEAGCSATIRHRIANHGVWPVPLAPWALTMLRPGGRAIIPNEPFVPFPERLSPARPLVLWSYTTLSDPRWSLGDRYVVLAQDPGRAAPQKMGARVTNGWSAYLREDELFVKAFDCVEQAAYRDFGSNLECYVDDEMLELETLGPMGMLSPGASIEHVERWALYTGVPSVESEADIDREVRARALELVA